VKAQEHADGHGSSGETSDYYHLLQVDPDAPQLWVEEAYWYLVGSLLPKQAVREEARQRLIALNAAYALLAHPERRRAYDATVRRVTELRLQRSQRDQPSKKRPPDIPPDSPRDYYELLHVDRSADQALIERAYSILRVLHAKRAGEMPGEYLAELTTALTTLLDDEGRAAYDHSLEEAAVEAESHEPRAPAEGTATGAESSRGPAWPARAVAQLSTVFATLAEGALGNRGSSRGPANSGKSGATRVTAGGQRQGRQRRLPRAKATGRLPDERLLRDAASLPAKATRDLPDGPCLGRLIVRSPAGEDETVDLGEEPVTLGSDRECDVRLAAEPGPVAPAHAQIWFTGERFVIRSLDPTHPTVLCGQRVNWAGLDDGDEIEIGAYRLRFEAVEAWGNPPDFLTADHEAVASAEEIPERHE
jgi:curved DNA-binding protein CbpA